MYVEHDHTHVLCVCGVKWYPYHVIITARLYHPIACMVVLHFPHILYRFRVLIFHIYAESDVKWTPIVRYGASSSPPS